MKKQILDKIKELEKKYNVKIIWAIESGSRAWKFASKDSDYDIRCMHISNKEDYLGLDETKKQINYMKGDLDIESWDIKKFASLMLKSNPQIAEWLRSPIIYKDSEIRKTLKQIFDKGCSLDFLKIHYLRMAKQNYGKYIKEKKKSSCKKYLYVLRGIACSRYIEKNKKLPPLPYSEIIPYLPKYIQDFFNTCVIKKNESEGKVIETKQKIINFIEKSFKKIPENKKLKTKKRDFKEKEKLNRYVVKTILNTK